MQPRRNQKINVYGRILSGVFDFARQALRLIEDVTVGKWGRPTKEEKKKSDNITILSDRGTNKSYLLRRLHKKNLG